MRTIADLARMTGKRYSEFYALIASGHIDPPSHVVPLRRKPMYSEVESIKIINQVRRRQEALADDSEQKLDETTSRRQSGCDVGS
jgi:hypothetical protein